MSSHARFVMEGLAHQSLRGNSNAHWTLRSKHRKAMRTEAERLGKEWIADNPDMEFPIDGDDIHVAYVFQCPRVMDLDNLIPGMKSFLDGLEDAGVIGNDRDVLQIHATKIRSSIKHTGVSVAGVE